MGWIRERERSGFDGRQGRRPVNKKRGKKKNGSGGVDRRGSDGRLPSFILGARDVARPDRRSSRFSSLFRTTFVPGKREISYERSWERDHPSCLPAVVVSRKRDRFGRVRDTCEGTNPEKDEDVVYRLLPARSGCFRRKDACENYEEEMDGASAKVRRRGHEGSMRGRLHG